jgi:hypothetical protein
MTRRARLYIITGLLFVATTLLFSVKPGVSPLWVIASGALLLGVRLWK